MPKGGVGDIFLDCRVKRGVLLFERFMCQALERDCLILPNNLNQIAFVFYNALQRVSDEFSLFVFVD